jgi:hypothetical protein
MCWFPKVVIMERTHLLLNFRFLALFKTFTLTKVEGTPGMTGPKISSDNKDILCKQSRAL